MQGMQVALLASAFSLVAGTAAAEFIKIDDKTAFVSAVTGKTLTRPFVKINVSPAGSISGKGARWDISGDWSWQNGYFCRDLEWGGDDIGYNCQEVKIKGSTIRFTSDRGAGDYADFKLR